MSLTLMHRRSGPASVAVLLAFAMSLVPHGAGAAQRMSAPAEAPEQSVAEPEPADDPAASPPEPPASHRSDLTVEDTRPKVQKIPQEEAEPPRSKSLRDTARTSAAERQVPSSPMQPMSLPTGENKTGVSAQSISVPKGPGTIEGMGESFSAQASTGIATFSRPSPCPRLAGMRSPPSAFPTPRPAQAAWPAWAGASGSPSSRGRAPVGSLRLVACGRTGLGAEPHPPA